MTPASIRTRIAASDGSDQGEILDWRLPYRSMDASGSPDTAEAVAWAWIDEQALIQKFKDPDSLVIETPATGNDCTIIALYRCTELLACATIFRDQMNFSVLVRWLSPAIIDAVCAAVERKDETNG